MMRPHLVPLSASPAKAGAVDLRTLFEEHYASMWRLLRRLGVRVAHLDDATQEVFWVAARRLGDIDPARAHSFLYGVALRIAANERRRENTTIPLLAAGAGADILETADWRPSPEQQVAARQARALLDDVLDRMPPELRAVLVLFELEGLEVKQIAEIEAIPVGTASSRLRRAREEFSAIAKRVRAGLNAGGGGS